MKILVVIPVHNEIKQIAAIVAEARKKGLDVLVIDDGSTDGSGEAARSQGASVLRHSCRAGKGMSLQDGFAYACQNGYDGVVTLDGDGQHAVDDIDVLLRKASEDPHSVVNGSRMGDTRPMPFVRLVTNRLMSGLISFLCGQRIADSQCGFRYLSTEIIRNISLSSSDFEIETEVLIKASRKGYKIHSVPIHTIYRNEKSKISPLKDTMRFLVYLFKELSNPQAK